MFPNQISTRELLSGSQSTQDYSRDFSQLQNAQYTQFDMSQNLSQDFNCSQPDQYSAGSTQDVQSQERRVPSYEKYMAKPLFGTTNNKGRVTNRNINQQSSQPHARPVVVNPKQSQQQMHAFKNRTKEKEERDMLSSIVCIVKECSDEVKQNLNSLKEADQDKGDVLKKAVDKLSSTVEESSNKILKAIHSREELVSQHLSLQQDIRKKDEKIQDLLRKSSDVCVKEVTSSMQDTIKSFLQDQHSATEHKLQKIMDTTKEQFKLLQDICVCQKSGQEDCKKQHSDLKYGTQLRDNCTLNKIMDTTKEQFKLLQDIGVCQKSGQEDSKKQHSDLKYSSERQLQDIEKRLQMELGLLRDDFDRQRRDMENVCKNQIQSIHQKYVRDIQQQISRGLENSVSNVSEFTKDFCREQQSEMKDLLRQQQKEVEASLLYQTSKQAEKLLKQSQEQSLKSSKDMKKDLTGKLDALQSKQQKLIDSSDKQFKQLKEAVKSNETNRPWINENVPTKVQDQLNELHDTHIAEIKRLEKEIEDDRKEREKKEAKSRECNRMGSIAGAGSLENVYDFQEDESNKRRNASNDGRTTGSMFGKESTFLSPRPPNASSWSSKSLFRRVNPSPVATVLPQRNTSSQNQPAKSGFENFPSQSHDHNETGRAFTRELRSNSKPSNYNMMNRVNEVALYNPHTSDNASSSQEVALSSGGSRKRSRQNRSSKGKKSKSEVHMNDSHSVGPVSQSDNSMALHASSRDEQRPQQTVSAVGPVRPVTSGLSQSGHHSSSMYDFHEETSPVQPRYSNTNSSALQIQPYSRHSSAVDKLLMSPESESSDLGSSNSSPSVSVTEVFIRRRIRHDAKTPTIKESQQRDVMMPDFLSTPNLTELFTDGSMQRMENIHARRSAASEHRLAERRKLCDFDTEVVQTIQCSNKRSRRYKNM